MNAKRNPNIIPPSLSVLPSLKLLRMGWDTMQIAQAKGLTEASVYNQLDAIRENERRLAEMSM